MQREGLGAEFLEEIEHLYKVLLNNPNTYSYYEEPVRQGKVHRFPYLVVYEVFDTQIIIYSVFMTRHDPDKKRAG